MSPGGPPPIDLAELEQRLGLATPRGPVALRPGLTAALRDLAGRIGSPGMEAHLDSLGAGAAVASWAGMEYSVSLYVSSLGPEHLRRTLLRAGLRATHGPPSMLGPGNPQLGDASYTLGPIVHFFSRGNLGAMVASEEDAAAALELARRIDQALQEGPTVSPAELAARAPKIADFRASATQVNVGATTRLQLDVAEDWRGRARLFFELDPSRFDVRHVADEVLELKVRMPGTTDVTGCAVDPETLLSAGKSVTLTLVGDPPPGPAVEPPEEES